MITITHARMSNVLIPSFGVKLYIQIPREELEVVRKNLQEYFQVDRVHLTYTEYDTDRHIS